MHTYNTTEQPKTNQIKTKQQYPHQINHLQTLNASAPINTQSNNTHKPNH